MGGTGLEQYYCVLSCSSLCHLSGVAAGVPVWNNNESLTVGRRGPVLLEDYHLTEKLAQFDRQVGLACGLLPVLWNFCVRCNSIYMTASITVQPQLDVVLCCVRGNCTNLRGCIPALQKPYCFLYLVLVHLHCCIERHLTAL